MIQFLCTFIPTYIVQMCLIDYWQMKYQEHIKKTKKWETDLIKRTMWEVISWAKDGYEGEKVRPATKEQNAQLIGSLIQPASPTDPQLHAPVIDIDWPCQLQPSTTEGHHHLYIDKAMTWRQYKKLLKAMVKAGIVEKGYYTATCKKQQSMVRKPNERKRQDQAVATPLVVVRLKELQDQVNRFVDEVDPPPESKSAKIYF